MRYVRMYVGSETGEPGLTLYEIGPDGRVYRQVQIHAEGTKFSPEDILMCQPVNPDYMVMHPAAEEIEWEDFEMLWNEVDDSRGFMQRIPDPGIAWQGTLRHKNRGFSLLWQPHSEPRFGYARVPGFVHLYVLGNREDAWNIYSAIFLETPIEWQSLLSNAA